MAPIVLIPCGIAITLTQNLAYALPNAASLLHIVGSAEVSNDNQNWTAVTLDTNSEALIAAQFVRSTGSGTILVAKR